MLHYGLVILVADLLHDAIHAEAALYVQGLDVREQGQGAIGVIKGVFNWRL